MDEALVLVQAEEDARAAVVARVAPAVVCIFDEKRGGGGAGVIISPDGLGLTNYHVVAGLMKTRRGLGGLPDGKLYSLKVLGIDPTGDVAMFRLSGKDRFEPAPLGDSDTVRVGDWVLAMGNPFALSEDYTPTVTRGVVSGVHRYQFGKGTRQLVYTDCLQIDASINPGNSGGPLFDAQGRVIGINGRASFEQRGRVNVGLAYAITINQIKRFIPGLRAGLLMEHGSLGATTVDLGYRRVVFEKMLEPSAASAAGIRVGDRLVRFAGRDIHSSNQFANLLGVYPADWPVEVAFERDGMAHTRTIRLDRLPVNMPESFKADEGTSRAEVRQAVTESQESPASLPIECAAESQVMNGFTPAIDRVMPAVVKIHGGRLGSERGFGTGVIVSPAGEVVTVSSLLLEAADIRVYTSDGLLYRAEVTYRDEYRQLAMLQLARQPENLDTAARGRDAMPAPAASFEALPMAESRGLRRGDWILVVGNPFQVAEGEEPMSVLKGVVAGCTTLDAEHNNQPVPYHGDVMLLDAISSNPGSPGSPVVDLSGRWVGLVGRIVTSRFTNTLLNYAYPIEEVEAFVEDARSAARAATRPSTADAQTGYHGIRLSKIAYRRELPFVRIVAKGSPAEAAGLKPDDLIISANGTGVPSARVFLDLCDRLHAGDELSLVVKRGEALLTIRFTLTQEPE